MVSGELFDALDYIARFIRRKDEPFGGIQLICTGDFLQLPPVEKSGKANFAFQAEAWFACNFVNIELTTVFRQVSSLFLDISLTRRKTRLSSKF